MNIRADIRALAGCDYCGLLPSSFKQFRRQGLCRAASCTVHARVLAGIRHSDMIARDQHTTLCAAVETMCTSLNWLLVPAGCRYLMCAEVCW